MTRNLHLFKRKSTFDFSRTTQNTVIWLLSTRQYHCTPYRCKKPQVSEENSTSLGKKWYRYGNIEGDNTSKNVKYLKTFMEKR